ncbi:MULTISPECIES: alpha/beta fold hydrolase [unclassified Nocardia]|uniref:alpha/beta fold hydrolase n=1 Tax=unclassified Nocardia TaxID=2637762 RepID=UPI001CE4604B|nr:MULTISPECIES: alpha/beta hydrolase [unclassified Nocardia]
MSVEFQAGSVTSADGTTIGYLRTGSGPALVLLHGSNQSGRSLSGLAAALSDSFTVYLPDRRGRGGSGPHRPGHSLRTEVADLAAVLEMSGAELVFGISSSGVIALEAARTLPGIRKLAAYEPGLLLDDSGIYTDWVTRFDRELAEGRDGAAIVTCLLGFDLAPAAMKFMPRRMLAAFIDAAMKKEDRTAPPDAITLRKMTPTLRYEAVILAEKAGRLADFADLRTDVLLLRGTKKGPAFILPAFEALDRVLPNHRSVVLNGLDHGSPADRSQTNEGGNPAAVAPELRRYFGGAE